jgi:hypothetical protein
MARFIEHSSPPGRVAFVEQSGAEGRGEATMNGRAWALVAGFTILVLILALLVALGSEIGVFPEPTDLNTDASAAILALVGAAAIGIERIIETLWTMLGQATGNQRWPLNLVADDVSRLVDSMNEDLAPFLEKVQEGIDEAGEVAGAATEQLRVARETVEDIKGSIRELQALAPENPRARAAVAAVSRGIGYLEGTYPDLRDRAQSFNDAASKADELLNQVNDNPARRLISILVGSFLGLLVAGIMGLDLIGATLGPDPWGTGADQPWLDLTFPNLGAAVTGLVMGLGASPTHELIKTLQETKKNRKAENNAS